jgi:hypothetical protein
MQWNNLIQLSAVFRIVSQGDVQSGKTAHRLFFPMGQRPLISHETPEITIPQFPHWSDFYPSSE